MRIRLWIEPTVAPSGRETDNRIENQGLCIDRTGRAGGVEHLQRDGQCHIQVRADARQQSQERLPDLFNHAYLGAAGVEDAVLVVQLEQLATLLDDEGRHLEQ